MFVLKINDTLECSVREQQAVHARLHLVLFSFQDSSLLLFASMTLHYSSLVVEAALPVHERSPPQSRSLAQRREERKQRNGARKMIWASRLLHPRPLRSEAVVMWKATFPRAFGACRAPDVRALWPLLSFHYRIPVSARSVS